MLQDWCKNFEFLNLQVLVRPSQPHSCVTLPQREIRKNSSYFRAHDNFAPEISTIDDRLQEKKSI